VGAIDPVGRMLLLSGVLAEKLETLFAMSKE
jgi:hypothetical protein